MDRNEPKKAAALQYDPREDTAPRVVALGQGEMAEKIQELAKENNITLYQDKELVEKLLAVEVNNQIPPELYRVIAEVLAFISRLDQMS